MTASSAANAIHAPDDTTPRLDGEHRPCLRATDPATPRDASGMLP